MQKRTLNLKNQINSIQHKVSLSPQDQNNRSNNSSQLKNNMQYQLPQISSALVQSNVISPLLSRKNSEETIQQQNQKHEPLHSSKVLNYYLSKTYVHEQTKRNAHSNSPFKAPPNQNDSRISLKQLEKQKDKLVTPFAKVFFQMNSKSEEKMILPCQMNINGLNEQKVNIQNMRYGNKYIEVLHAGIKQSNQNITEFHLSRNRLTKSINTDFIRQIAQTGNKIDLSFNQIGKNGVQTLCQCISLKQNQLYHLNLEGNNLGDLNIQNLCNNILDSNLKYLNLAKNQITNQTSDHIVNVLIRSELQVLILHWNLIKAAGASKIFQALQQNRDLQLFDISFNSIMTRDVINPIQDIIKFFKINSTLLHLDIGYNQIDFEQTQILSEALKLNQSLIGFHYDGNNGYLDQNGFLIPSEIIKHSEMTRIKSLHAQIKIQSKLKGKYLENQYQQYSNCWICEGWNQILINLELAQNQSQKVFIHLSFCDFKPELIEDALFITMAPPGQILFFFSTENEYFIDQNYQKIKQKQIIKIESEGNQVEVKLNELNFLNNQQNKNIVQEYEKGNLSIYPRTIKGDNKQAQINQPTIIMLESMKDLGWKLSTSIFKDWKKEDNKQVDLSLDFDWENTRIPKIVKNESDIQELKAYLKTIYKQLKETYKYFASINPINDVWALQSLPYLQFLNSIKLSENSYSEYIQSFLNNPSDQDLKSLERARKTQIKQQDLDLKFISTYSGTQRGNPRKPDRGVVRHQFLELLVRLVEEKYIKNKLATNFTEGMKMFYDDHLKYEIHLHSTQQWREQRYWNEQCEKVFKSYKQVIDFVFNKYSVKKVKPGQKKFVSLDEFQTLCNQSGLLELPHFPASTPQFAYNSSMMPQIDELNSNRIFEMTYVEFLEGLARIAEEACLEPIANIFKKEQKITMKELKELDLHFKLESLVYQIHCNDLQLKSTVKLNGISIFEKQTQEVIVIEQ